MKYKFYKMFDSVRKVNAIDGHIQKDWFLSTQEN